MPRKPAKPTHVETRGRPAIPESLRRRPFNCRLPQRTLDTLSRLASEHGTNPGIEVERLVDATTTAPSIQMPHD